MAATQEEVEEVEGFGPDRAESSSNGSPTSRTARSSQELRDLGLRFESGEEDRPVEGPLTGKQYVITGTLEAFTREEAAAALEALGAKVSNSVSSKTTALIVGEDPGKSKVTKAEKAGIPQLGEAELLELLGSG